MTNDRYEELAEVTDALVALNRDLELRVAKLESVLRLLHPAIFVGDDAGDQPERLMPLGVLRLIDGAGASQ